MQQKHNNPQVHAAAVQAMRNRLRFGVTDSRTAWELAKAAQRVPGRSESEVISLAMKKNPELVAALAAYQSPAAARPVDLAQAYEAKVAAGIARGLKRSDAICAAMRDLSKGA